MKKPLMTAIALAAALPFILAGCSSADAGSDGSTDSNDTSPVRDAESLFGDLQSAGSIPKDFPQTQDLRVEVDDNEFALAWKGDPLTTGCAPAEASPNSTARILLIADGSLTNVQQCGTLWQAVQSDGSNVAWN